MQTAKRILVWVAGLAAIVVATGGLMYFATSGATQLRVEGTRLMIDGSINTATLESFESLVERHDGLTTVVLGDIPGSATIAPVVMLGYRIRALQLDAEIAPGAEVVGDAAFLFLSGVSRKIGPDGRLIVSDWGGGDLPQEDTAHQERQQYVGAMLGDDTFYWYTLRRDTGPVPAGDLAGFGVITAP